ncbi:hypothetical protein U8P80_16195 [Rhizobium beringeri]|nr:hypothetical protein U8P80_16195 [Rhizobium beringeri]WSH13271.1 hypothetical protein U8P74_16195 [Rhizobium beringeri]
MTQVFLKAFSYSVIESYTGDTLKKTWKGDVWHNVAIAHIAEWGFDPELNSAFVRTGRETELLTQLSVDEVSKLVSDFYSRGFPAT